MPATHALADELISAQHIGVARFGVAVRLDETMQVTDVLLPLSASGLTGPEIGSELTVALERARIKATASLRRGFGADPALAAELSPAGPADEAPEPETRAVAYLSDNGLATVYRVVGGPVRSVELGVGEYSPAASWRSPYGRPPRGR